MKKGRPLVILLSICILSAIGFGQSPKPEMNENYYPGKLWRTSTPEAQGMDSQILLKMFKTFGNQGRIVIIRNGYLVTIYNQAYLQNDLHHIHSCTKSIISALIGEAIKEGYIKGIDQKVLASFPEFGRIKNLDERKRKMTIQHLLTMTSGMEWTDSVHPTDSEKMIRTQDWVRYVLERPLVAEPGQVWNYNSGGSQLVSVILQKTTGRSAQDYAQEKLFQPLGIHSVRWWSDPQGYSTAGWGLHLSTFDMAKIGYLFLRRGRWGDRELIPSEWVKESTTNRVSVKSGFGEGYDYGYQWWVYNGLRFYAYKAWGSLENHSVMIIVVPDMDMVVVMAGANNSDKRILESYIFPAIKSSEPLPNNPEALKDLKHGIEKCSN